MFQRDPMQFAIGVAEIGPASSQEEVEEILQRLAESVGASRWVFIAHEQADDDDQERVHILDGGLDGFAEQYVERRWYLIDPQLHHARDSGVVRWGWQHDLTPGQREMKALWEARGHQGIAVFPAHGPWRGIAGALYFGFDTGGESMPFSVHMMRHAVRSLSIEVLHWVVKRSYLREVGPIELTPIERQILQLDRLGCTVKQTAEALQVPARDIQRMVHVLNAKLHVNHKRQAARLAVMAGVLQ